VAANLATVGIGEDTGGSIRLPASFNNLVGVRVTPGLISRSGMSPLVVFQDTAGPMTRTVTDAAVLLDGWPDTIQGSLHGGLCDRRHGELYAASLPATPKGRADWRLTQAFGSDTGPETAQVNALVRAAIKRMEASGPSSSNRHAQSDRAYCRTSLYLLHSRHDIDEFLGARPGFPQNRRHICGGKYHRYSICSS
jgi:Asp-tRNA(Asn)/Glu-tRNA(Gln) amidotransferase A subunit family amidase